MPFRIERNDITKISCDAIVNTANPAPIIGNGTNTAIYRAAGEDELLQARKHIGPIARGQAVATPAFNLKKNGVKYIIHTVGNRYQKELPETVEILRACYRNALGVAKDFGCESVAIPLLATGCYSFPKDLALQVAQEEINNFLEQQEDMQVILVVYDQDSYLVSKKQFKEIQSFIDENYVARKESEDWDEDEGYDEAWDEEYEEQNEEVVSAEKTANNSVVNTVPNKSPFLQQQKPTAKKELSEEIQSKIISHLRPRFQEKLWQILAERQIKPKDIYKKVFMDHKYFSKMINSKSIPKKKTVMVLGLALEFPLEQYEDFLASAGYCFMPSSKFDLIVKYCVMNNIYNFIEMDNILYKLTGDSFTDDKKTVKPKD